MVSISVPRILLMVIMTLLIGLASLTVDNVFPAIDTGNPSEYNLEQGKQLFIQFYDITIKYDDNCYDQLIPEDVIVEQVSPKLGDWGKLASKELFFLYIFDYGPNYYYNLETNDVLDGWEESFETKKLIVQNMEEAGFGDNVMLFFLEYWNWVEFQSRSDGYVVDVIDYRYLSKD